MVWGWLLLIYLAYAVDLHGGLRSLCGLAPASLDLALIALLATGRGTGLVVFGSIIGLLSAVVLGTLPAVEMLAAGSLGALVATLRRQSLAGPLQARSVLLPSLVVLTLTAVRGGQMLQLSGDGSERAANLWLLAGTLSLTLITALGALLSTDLLWRPAERRL